MVLKLFSLLSSLMIISSCSGDDLFSKKSPPLPGERVNVLHYEMSKESKFDQKHIKFPAPSNLHNWPVSDVGQFTGTATNIALPDDLKLTKEFTINDFSRLEHNNSILIANDILYSYSNGILSSYKNGKNIWSMQVLSKADKDDVLGGSITYDNQVIYIASGSRNFIAVNAADGKELWQYQMPNVIRSPALIYEGKIYITSVDNKLSCLDLKGNLLWLYDAPVYSLARSRIYSPSVIYEDKIITITTAGDLIVLNRFNGQELTQVNIANNSIIGDGNLSKGPIASPILIGKNLYILNSDGYLTKIDLSKPEIMWRQNFSSAISLWISGNVIYMLTEDHQLLAIEDNFGQLIWVTDLVKETLKNKKPEFHGPILVDNKLMLTSVNGDLLFFSPLNGEKLDEISTKLTLARMPLIADGKMYFIAKNGKVAIWE